MADLFGSSNDEIDFDAAASAFPDISLDGEGDLPAPMSAAPPQQDSGFSFDDFDTPPQQQQSAVKVTGDDEIEKFENEFPDIDVPTSPPVQKTPTFAATFAPRPQPSALSSTPIFTQSMPEDEPEVIRAWREKQQEEIAARDQASEQRRQETKNKAERSMDEFYEAYSRKKTDAIASNKEKEAQFIQELADSLSAGTTWERIGKLIELENSQSKTIARAGPGTTDLTRYKEVLLRLKRAGDTAPGAGGY